jgi:hypothetical protein
MQHIRVIQSARGRWLAGAAVIAGTMLVSACGSSNPAAATSSSGSATPGSSGVAPAPSAAPSTASAPAPTTAPASPAVTPTAPVNPGGTNDASQTCAQMAAHNTYLYITQAPPAAGGTLTVTGSPAKLICGGPDDSHYDVARNVETGHVVAGANIEVFPTTTSQMRDVPIKASALNTYLKTDSDTKIFLVGGPLSAITSLREQFHP